jgi:uncharacterized protein with GYD domain
MMPKFLIQANYKPEGLKGLIKEGGSKRRTTVEQMTAGFGGKVEAFYYAFGDTDAFLIIDAPDNVTAAAVSMAVNASGLVNTVTTPLLTPEEVDQATKKSVTYRAPGQ